MPLLMVFDGRLSSAPAGDVLFAGGGTKGALPCANTMPPDARSRRAANAWRISVLPRSIIVVGVGPALDLARFQGDGDIRFPTQDGVDRPEIDAGNRLVGTNA